MKTQTMVMLLLSSVVVSLAGEDARATPANSHETRRCTVTLDTPPPTLTRLLIVHKERGTTHEVLWDPTTRVQLVQYVYLSGWPENYLVAVQAESNFSPGSEKIPRWERAWVAIEKKGDSNWILSPPHATTNTKVQTKPPAEESAKPTASSGQVSIECRPVSPSIEGYVNRLGDAFEPGALREISSVAMGGGRGFLDQTLSQPIHELFSLVADVVVERVERYAFARLKEVVVGWLCGSEDGSSKAKLRLPLPGLGDVALFPAVCEQVRRISFRDLAASGKAILRALLADAARAAKGLAALVVTQSLGLDMTVAKDSLLKLSNALTRLQQAVAGVESDHDLLKPIGAALKASTELERTLADKRAWDSATLTKLNELGKKVWGLGRELAEVTDQDLMKAAGKLTSEVLGLAAGLVDSRFSSLIDPVLDALSSAATGQPLDTTSLAQALLLGVLEHPWVTESCSRENQAPCVVRTILLAGQECMQAGNCTAQTVGLALGGLFAAVEDLSPGFEKSLRQNKSRLTTLALRFADLVSGKTTGSRRVVREAVDWVFDAYELVVELTGGLGAERLDEWKRRIQAVAELVDAALAGEAQRLLLALGAGAAHVVESLLPDGEFRSEVRETLGKVVAVLSTVASFLTEPEGTATAEDRAALRESRKQALHNLIDEMTERKPDQWVFSLSASLGLRLDATWPNPDAEGADSDVQWLSTPISLPLGLTMQYTPGPEGSDLGLVLGLDVFDLGGFLQLNGDGVARDNLTLGTLLAPGVQLGFSFGDAAMPVVVATSVRYRPHYPDGSATAVQWGLTVSWQVPLVDFWTSPQE